MGLSVHDDAAPAEPPGWHLWLSPSGRWFAARTTPATETSAMIVSAASRGELDTCLTNVCGEPVGA